MKKIDRHSYIGSYYRITVKYDNEKTLYSDSLLRYVQDDLKNKEHGGGKLDYLHSKRTIYGAPAQY